MKIKTILTLLVIIGNLLPVSGKEKEGVIMQVDGEEVPTSEFLYLFNKNNLQQVEPQTLEEYLELFKVYRLKVAEAKSQGVDTTASFRNEMAQYRRELLEPYVSDTTYFRQMVEEAVGRDSILVESSHIMIIRTHDEEKDQKNLAMLDSLRKEILSGGDFIQAAKNYSEDKFSSDKGGYLGYNPAGTFPYDFETAVYETPEGEISEIVESHVGWHIVKPGGRKRTGEFDRQVRPYETIRGEVEKRTSSPFDSRYHKIRKNVINRLGARHPEIDLSQMDEDEAFNKLMSAEEVTQYAENPDYRNLIDEYINGSLLYVVSVDNIWDKASNDTEGLESFYQAHKDNYKWDKPHAKGLLVQARNDSVAALIMLEVAGMPTDSVGPYIRKNFKRDASVDRFNVGEGTNAMIDHLMFGGEETTPKNKNFTSYFILEGRLVENPEELGDVRSAVINDYQEALEIDWIKSLRAKHQLEVNKSELKRIKKSLEKKK